MGIGTQFRNNFLLRCSVYGGVLFIFIFLFLLPQLLGTLSKKKDVSRIYGENDSIQRLILSTENSGEKLREIQDKLQQYQKMIPLRERLSDVLDKIASRAELDGLEVLSLKTLRDLAFKGDQSNLFPEKSGRIFEVQVTMKAQGSYRQIGNYFTQLEKAPYKILIRQFQLESPKTYEPESREEPKLILNLTMGILMEFPPA